MNDVQATTSPDARPSPGYETPTLDQTVLKTARGSSVIFAGKLFVFISAFFTSFILARFLGPEQYGQYKLTLTVIATASSLTFLGLDLGLIRHVALYLNRQDTRRVWGTLQVGIGVPALLSFLAAGILILLSDILASKIFKEPGLAPYLRLSCLFLPFITLNSMFTAAIKGFNRMTLMVAADRFAKSSAKLILLILFALLGLNVTRAISAFGIAEVTAVVLALYFINRIFPLRRSLENSTREIRKLFVFSLPVYLSNTIQMFSYNIQTLLLGSLNSIFNVGIFSLATQINMIGSLFHSSIIGASMPVVSTLYDQQKIKALNRYYQATSRWTFTLNLPLFLIIVSYPETILRVFGQSFTQGVSALTILAWANLVNTGTGTCGVVLDMTGHTKLKLINSIITVVLTVALNLLLIPSLGLVGGAIASLVSVSVTNVLRIGEIFAHLKILPYNANFLKSIAAGVFAWLTSLALRSTIIPGIDLLSMAFNAVVLSLVFGVTIYLLGLSHEEWVILAELQQWLGRKFSRDQKGDRS